MSNTGHKGIHWRAGRGVFQVIVQWQFVMLWGTCDTLEEAIVLRRSFETQLHKPRTERRILPHAKGISLTTSGSPGRANYRRVAQAHVAPAPGKRRTTTYVMKGDEEGDRLAISNALNWRKKMEARYYR